MAIDPFYGLLPSRNESDLRIGDLRKKLLVAEQENDWKRAEKIRKEIASLR
jgi:hypothetical protein